jgi:hypothetical protein
VWCGVVWRRRRHPPVPHVQPIYKSSNNRTRRRASPLAGGLVPQLRRSPFLPCRGDTRASPESNLSGGKQGCSYLSPYVSSPLPFRNHLHSHLPRRGGHLAASPAPPAPARAASAFRSPAPWPPPCAAAGPRRLLRPPPQGARPLAPTPTTR